MDPVRKRKIEIAAAKRCANVEDALDRHYPKIVDLTNNMLVDKLSKEEYPYVRDPPPSQSSTATVSLRRSRTGLSNAVSPMHKTRGPRLFVVVLGGATFTELRHLYEQSRQTGVQVILVSTHFITSQEYLDSLERIRYD